MEATNNGNKSKKKQAIANWNPRPKYLAQCIKNQRAVPSMFTNILMDFASVHEVCHRDLCSKEMSLLATMPSNSSNQVQDMSAKNGAHGSAKLSMETKKL